MRVEGRARNDISRPAGLKDPVLDSGFHSGQARQVQIGRVNPNFGKLASDRLLYMYHE
jgi:hypothetical protein